MAAGTKINVVISGAEVIVVVPLSRDLSFKRVVPAGEPAKGH